MIAPSTNVKFLEIEIRNRVRLHSVALPQPAICRIVTGEKRLLDGKTLHHATHGSLVLLPGQEPAEVENIPADGTYRAQLISLPPTLLRPFDEFPQARPKRRARDAEGLGAWIVGYDDALAESWNRLWQAHQKGADELLLWHMAQELLLRLRLMGRLQPLLKELADTTQSSVRSIFQSDLERPWSQTEVAQALHMSEATLRRRLQGSGTSFRALLFEARMSHALTLLQSTRDPVANIAGQCGFASHSRFSSRFRQRYGVAPSEFRGP